MTLRRWKAHVKVGNLQDLAESELNITEQDINTFLRENPQTESYADSIDQVKTTNRFKTLTELLLDTLHAEYTVHDSGEDEDKLTILKL